MKNLILAVAAMLSLSAVSHAYEWQNPTKITDEGRERLSVSASSQNLLTGADSANKSVCFKAGMQLGYNRALLEHANEIKKAEKTSAEELKQAEEAIVTLEAKIKSQNSMVDFCVKSSI